jgi:uncharacterized protein YcfL
MITRILALAALALVVVSSPARAQGRSPQQVVLSPSVLKSLAAQKQKSKTPLTARVGMRRASISAVSAAAPAHSAPATVRAITKTPPRER